MIDIFVHHGFDEKLTDEAIAAEKLANIFRSELAQSECNGSLYFVPSAQLFGNEVRDVDILVLGTFDPPLQINVFCAATQWNGSENIRDTPKIRNVFVRSICWSIEVKSHSSSGIRIEGNQVNVSYLGRWHSASNQSMKAVFAVRSYLRENFSLSAYVTNLIWLRNVDTHSLSSIVGEHNILTSMPTLRECFRRSFSVQLPFEYQAGKSTHYRLDAFSYTPDIVELNRAIQDVAASFTKPIPIGTLTRSKLELLTRDVVDTQLANLTEREKRLLIFRGEAGTGKTMRLLHLARHLCVDQGKRCLILTYNRALQSDLQRLVFLAGIPADSGEATVEVRTVHSFIYRLASAFGLLPDKSTSSQVMETNSELPQIDEADEHSFFEQYDSICADLANWGKDGLLTYDDIQKLTISKREHLEWDVVLVDEAQDWPDQERDILFSLYGPDRLAVSESTRQMIRSIRPTDWATGLQEKPIIRSEVSSMRQKSNLVRFVRAVAEGLDMTWNVEERDQLPGGQVILTTWPYSNELHQSIYADCKEPGNEAYEMLFLVPPILVDKATQGRAGGFRYAKEWHDAGIQFWDGTRSVWRSAYPSNAEEHRLLQYESCRGLEGWSVVCLCLDDFYLHKLTHAPLQELRLYHKGPISDQELQRRYASQWLLIPLSRAVDTTVIVIRDWNSFVGRLLKDIQQRYSDFIVIR